ncbi:MAG TPA: hypothetical protein VE863_15315 [Pyrinomonadaceae bacterium]|jgi:hypothetical protein|nr:hypothetical protein [Pyrinomonadaceae bacterium]
MKHVIVFTLIVLVVSAFAFGQKKPAEDLPKCALRLDQSPELRGFRMGMTETTVLAKLPGVTIEKPNKFGLARLRISLIDTSGLIKASAKDRAVQPDITASPEEGSAFVIDVGRFPAFKGVRRMQMRFIDGRLSYLEVTYDDAIKWESLDQFIDTVSTTLKLPKDWQRGEDAGDQEKELRCDGFVLTASTSGDAADVHAGPELILQDTAAWNAMSKRQNDVVEKAKQDDAEKRKAFKP